MSNQCEPIETQWYLQRDNGKLFEVIAVDSDEGIIDIQNFDGDIEEMDLCAWRMADIVLTAAPEDWTGPFDDIEADDSGYVDTVIGLPALCA